MNVNTKETLERKQSNMGWLLFLLSAAFWVFNRYQSRRIALVGYCFTSALVFPGLFFLLGRESRQSKEDQRGLIWSGAGMIALGYAQKVLLFWAETMAGRAPGFYPFSTSGAPWFFLVGGVYLILAGLIQQRDWMKRWLLPLAVGIGLFVGLLKPVGNVFCLARLAFYLPFFVLGRQLDEEKLAGWCRAKAGKLLSLLILGGWAVGCLLFRGHLKGLRVMMDGNAWYGSCTVLPKTWMGLFVRLGFYVLAAVLIFALWSLMPAWRVPLFSGQGRRWKSGYFWFSPAVFLLILPLNGGLTLKGAALTLLLCLAAALLAPSKLLNRLPEALLHGPERLQREEEPRALGKNTFYERHRWGIQLTALFTGCFLVAAVGYVYPFLSNGKSLIWQMDGLHQQYPMMMYAKRYLLEAFQRLVETGELAFPQWDFTMGFGMPVGDNIRREPFTLLSLFATEENLETLYNVVVVLRMYVCGLSFLWYCKELGKREKAPIVMGALVYTFSGFAIIAAVRQPFFITTMLTYLVVMLAGVERYVRQKKPGLFVAVVFLQFFNNYYSTYINSLLMALYLLLRLWSIHGKDVKAIAVRILKMMGYYFWGLAMAMTALLPTLLSFLSSGRSGEAVNVPAFYSTTYYTKLFTGLNLEAGSSGYRSYVSFASIAFLACVLLFLKRRKDLRPLKIGLCALAVFICLPVFGWIFNGFGYPTNRWCYAIPFLAALILVELAPELLRMSRRERVWMTLFVLAYGTVVVATDGGLTKPRYMGLVALGLTAILILMLRELFSSRRMQMAALALMTLLNVMFSTAVAISPDLGNYAGENVDAGTADTTLSGSMRAGLSVIADDSFYRVARPVSRTNQSLLLDYYGVNSYYSVINAGISDFFIDIGLNTQYQTFCIGGLDERAALTALASVKYYVTNSTKIVPYGFALKETVTEEGTDEVQAYVYENEYALPLGYTYTSYVTREEYEAMTALERQQVMLVSAVLENGSDSLEHGELMFREEPVACKVTGTQNVTLDEEAGTMATQSGGSITLEFEGKPGCENYLVIKGLRDTGSGSNSSTVRAKVNGATKEASLRSKSQNYYFERDAITFNLGYSEEAQSKCVISFSQALDLEYEEMYMVCVPMEGYEEQVSALGQTALENVVEEVDRITGTIDLEESRLLTFSIPYTPGWTVYVNGEEAELLKVNVMYCGVLLEPGSYEIELRYQQSGQTAGNVISAVAIAAVVPVGIVCWLRRRRDGRQDGAGKQ